MSFVLKPNTLDDREGKHITAMAGMIISRQELTLALMTALKSTGQWKISFSFSLKFSKHAELPGSTKQMPALLKNKNIYTYSF